MDFSRFLPSFFFTGLDYEAFTGFYLVSYRATLSLIDFGSF